MYLVVAAERKKLTAQFYSESLNLNRQFFETATLDFFRQNLIFNLVMNNFETFTNNY